ncbi:histidine phosphatase family protein [Schumannella sp. 10F1B-5-1]|uniref:histidine phosphatase family protein n=1 Tax=Schumannella sp. 10F1B-5-1 TaxID=2590780 RepID=UPI00112FF62C|nr:histidine phosphatase family protein [Schumannella sp. 10F1B-5-1]TPW70767.1 histidine phosphatase family protein [Schumannella sp. 10F1B-5-1]
MRVLLIRHGETPLNVAGVLDAVVPGPGLTDLGRQQAAALPRALAGEPVDEVRCSSMVRTCETAEPLARDRGLRPVLLDGVQEIEAGALQGRDDRAAIGRYLTTVHAWSDGSLAPRIPGGPDGREFLARFDAALARLDAERRTAGLHGAVAVVTHSAAIRVWCARRARNLPADFSARQPLANTAVVAVEGSADDGWIITDWAGSPVAAPPSRGADPMGEPLADLD